MSGSKPVSGRFLLDTNIINALLNGDDPVLFNLDQASEVFIPAVALGELLFGAAKYGRPAENTDKVQRFAVGRAVISCDRDVAREYGRLKHGLREKGRPRGLSTRLVWNLALFLWSPHRWSPR